MASHPWPEMDAALGALEDARSVLARLEMADATGSEVRSRALALRGLLVEEQRRLELAHALDSAAAHE